VLTLISKEFARTSEKSGVTRRQVSDLIDDVWVYLLEEHSKGKGVLQSVTIAVLVTKAGEVK